MIFICSWWEAAIATDASRVALTRIRDLNAPTDEMGDGRIYFLNLTDLQITHVETPIDSFIVSLFWSRDGEALLVSTFDNKYWRIDPRSGAATEIPYDEAFGGQFYPKAGGPRRVSCPDRKSTRLNSSHVRISYAVFCLK